MTRAGAALPTAVVAVVNVALASAAAACGGPRAPAGGLPDSTYVQVMARLALVDSAMAPSSYHFPDTLPRDSARALVLRRFGVRDSALLSYADALGGEPDHMQEVWTRIRSLADSLADGGWTPGADEGP